MAIDLEDIDYLNEIVSNFEDNEDLIIQNINQILKNISFNFKNYEKIKQETACKVLNKFFTQKNGYPNI